MREKINWRYSCEEMEDGLGNIFMAEYQNQFLGMRLLICSEVEAKLKAYIMAADLETNKQKVLYYYERRNNNS